jgi:UDP-galactopyranose mutase
MKHIAVVGAGFAGSVVARELAESGRFAVDVIESRGHVGGNCHAERRRGILVHVYGPHIFHTDDKRVWDFVQRFGVFRPFEHRVKAVTGRGVFSWPINLLTLNQFFGRCMTPADAKRFLALKARQGPSDSFEGKALAVLGPELYKYFLKYYTSKQWGVSPNKLPVALFSRVRFRLNYNDAYFDDRFQAMPEQGYTAIIDNMLRHPAITVRLGEMFSKSQAVMYDHVFFSGGLDRYFEQVLGALQYRTLDFEESWGAGDCQGAAVINDCTGLSPYTRTTEHKHLSPWESHPVTVCYREYSRKAQQGDTLYYPVGLSSERERLKAYRRAAFGLKGVTFLGRLGTYRYLDMAEVILESLELSSYCLSRPMHRWPVFANEIQHKVDASRRTQANSLCCGESAGRLRSNRSSNHSGATAWSRRKKTRGRVRNAQRP